MTDDGILKLAAPMSEPAEMVPPTPKPSEAGAEFGITNDFRAMVPYGKDWEIVRPREITAQQLMAMRQGDGQAQALYRLITLPILSALKGATFVPETGEEGGDEEAKFIERLLTLPPSAGGMTTPLRLVMAQMLKAVFDGFSAFELVYWSPAKGPLKDKWTLKKVAYRPPDTVTFLGNERGSFAGIRQKTFIAGKTIDVKIPADKSIYFTVQAEERPLYGRSMFHAAFNHWDKKTKAYFLAHLAAQKAASGTRIGTHPRVVTDKTELAKFQKSLNDFGIAQWMDLPEGYTVESLKESGSFDYLGLINHHNSQMSKSVLAAFFDVNQGAGVSDGAMVDFGKQSDALFLMMLESLMGGIADVINHQIIPRFIDWNFDSGKYPEFRWGTLTEDQKAGVRLLFERIVTAGPSLTSTPEFAFEIEKKMAEYLDLEIDYDEIARRKAEEAQLLEEAAAVVSEEAIAPTEPAPPSPGTESNGSLDIPSDILPPGVTPNG